MLTHNSQGKQPTLKLKALEYVRQFSEVKLASSAS